MSKLFKRIHCRQFLECYAGLTTSILTLMIYGHITWAHTTMDVLEILVTYGMFLLAPSFYIPYLIGGEDDDTK